MENSLWYSYDMIVNCPKCGFSQPDDQFCASCGVDMKLYAQRKKNSPREIGKNPALYLGLVVTIGAIGFVFFRTPLRELRDRVGGSGPITYTDKVEAPTPLEASGQNPGVYGGVYGDGAHSNGTSPAFADARQTGESGDGAAFKSFASTASPDGSNSPGAQSQTFSSVATATTGATKLNKSMDLQAQAVFFEADKSQVEQLIADMSSSGQFADFGDYRSGLIYNRTAFVEKFQQSFTTLFQTPPKNFNDQDLGVQWRVPGFVIRIQLESLREIPLKGRIGMGLLSREQTQALPAEKGFPQTSFELSFDKQSSEPTPSQAWLVLIDLANRLTASEYSALERQGPLSILELPKFKAKQSELGIFIDFR